jgi:hypothetical protein
MSGLTLGLWPFVPLTQSNNAAARVEARSNCSSAPALIITATNAPETLSFPSPFHDGNSPKIGWQWRGGLSRFYQRASAPKEPP